MYCGFQHSALVEARSESFIGIPRPTLQDKTQLDKRRSLITETEKNHAPPRLHFSLAHRLQRIYHSHPRRSYNLAKTTQQGRSPRKSVNRLLGQCSIRISSCSLGSRLMDFAQPPLSVHHKTNGRRTTASLVRFSIPMDEILRKAQCVA